MNTAQPIYDLAFFRSFFAEKTNWCVQSLADDNGNCCALGHTTARGNSVVPTDMSIFLCRAFVPLVNKDHWLGGLLGSTWGNGNAFCTIADINNGEDPRYKQYTPQARILAAIDDLIAMEETARAAELDAIETRPLVATESLVTA